MSRSLNETNRYARFRRSRELERVVFSTRAPVTPAAEQREHRLCSLGVRPRDVMLSDESVPSHLRAVHHRSRTMGCASDRPDVARRSTTALLLHDTNRPAPFVDTTIDRATHPLA